MATPPKSKGFLAEDYREAPEWFSKFLGPLNEYMAAVTNALTGRLNKDNFLAYDEALDFTTVPLPADPADTFPLKFKNRLLGGVRPGTVVLGQLHKHSNAALTAAYSMTWVVGPNAEIEVSFQGLENSTRYVGKLSVWG